MNVAEKVKLIKQGLLSSEKLCEECIADIDELCGIPLQALLIL